MSGLLSRWPLWGALLGLVVTVAAWVAFNPNEPPAIVLRPQDPQLLAMGQQVYNQHCAACHGAQLQGQANWRERGPNGRLPAPPHDSSGHTWHHPDEVLFQITKYGVAKVANLKDWQLQNQGPCVVNAETKRALVQSLYQDLKGDAGNIPVLVAVQKLATSLALVMVGERDKLDLPHPGVPQRHTEPDDE